MKTSTMQSTTWNMWVLIPMLFVELAVAVTYTTMLAAMVQSGFETSQESTGGRAFIMAMGPCLLLFMLVASVQWARQRLTHKTMVVANSIKAGIWLVFIIVDVSEGSHLYNTSSGVWYIQLMLLLCALAQLIYAAVLLRRQSRHALPQDDGYLEASGRGLEYDMAPGSSTGAGPVSYASRAASSGPSMSKSTEAFEELRSTPQDDQPLPVYTASAFKARVTDEETKKPAPGYWSNV